MKIFYGSREHSEKYSLRSQVKRQDLVELFTQDNNSRSVLRVSESQPFLSFPGDLLQRDTIG